MAPHKYFEDFSQGEMFETAPFTLTAEEIVAFAEKYDPQPTHLETPGLIASGWHTACLTMRLFVTCGWYCPPPGALGLGVEDLRWLKPVSPDDSIYLKIEVIGLRVSGSKPDYGILTNKLMTFNQRDELVQEAVSSALIPRR